MRVTKKQRVCFTSGDGKNKTNPIQSIYLLNIYNISYIYTHIYSIVTYTQDIQTKYM